MAVVTSSAPLLSLYTSSVTPFNCRFSSNISNPGVQSIVSVPSRGRQHLGHRRSVTVASQLCEHETLNIDKSALNVAEAVSEGELWATACLRVRSFYNFRPSVGIEDHKRYLAEREFEALKERVAGKREGFRRVSCINATLPLLQVSSFSDDLGITCKFSDSGEDRVVVGTLDLNQCVSLPDEITGMKPKGIGADFLRAYVSNVCVAKELHRNGLGYALVAKSKLVAENWGNNFSYTCPLIFTYPLIPCIYNVCISGNAPLFYTCTLSRTQHTHTHMEGDYIYLSSHSLYIQCVHLVQCSIILFLHPLTHSTHTHTHTHGGRHVHTCRY
ncbi:hypothetical protein F0562_009224 [Nyssa sinensis]|uniref:N-acetyltransferase domain-containing protein n=1 Tax=Nyssa sinensis TaxID=561372 RepID=A0A5J5A0B6_9ASTE|nr:hypothetical protein F0562_009224 [Nyssa sinensis]